jgi:RimJ/RimL family protein N-acetyltransferase
VSIVLPEFPAGYTLTTPRLTLQAPRAEDESALWPHVTDPRITTFLAWEPHQRREETAAMIDALIQAQIAGKGFHWIARHLDEVIGLMSLIDVRRTHRSWTWNRAELAYWITPAAQGHGFATEAAKAVMDFGFGPLSLHKLMVYHAADNPPSGRVVEKLGFRHVGDEREAFCKNGCWHDLRHYELLASEYQTSPCL